MFESVARVKSPTSLGPGNQGTHDIWGGQADWYWGVPLLHRALADPGSHLSLPECPLWRGDLKGHDDLQEVHSRGQTYWLCLEYLLRFQLGWTHPAQGLTHWMDLGAPPMEKNLALLKYLWLGDGFIERYLAWRVQKGYMDSVSLGWRERLSAVELPDFPDCNVGLLGPHGMHLEEFGGHTLQPQGTEKVVGLDFRPPPLTQKTQPHKALFLDTAVGWYATLANKGARYEHVAVFSKANGWMGTYHQSEVSGRWHTTEENVHLWGCRIR